MYLVSFTQSDIHIQFYMYKQVRHFMYYNGLGNCILFEVLYCFAEWTVEVLSPGLDCMASLFQYILHSPMRIHQTDMHNCGGDYYKTRQSRLLVMHLSISCPTPGNPHTPSGDLTLLLVPTPGEIDSCPQITDRFSVVAFLNNKIALTIILLATGAKVNFWLHA